MKLVGLVAVAALVVGVLVAGWARPGGSEGAKPAAPQDAPAVSPPAGARRPVPRPEADLSGSSGLNIRYLDKNGRTKKLNVEDFPR